MPEQRDDEWVKSASPEEIDRALIAGELDGLLGRQVKNEGGAA